VTRGEGTLSMINSVFFDVGETIVDESREYGTWADWLGIPRHTFSAMFGTIIGQGLDYRETFQRFRPGFDLSAERQRRVDRGEPETFGEEDLYPDARPCLAALRAMGLQVGVAGNQTNRAERILRGLGLPVDVIGTSDGWGVEKPDPAFFDRLLAESGYPPPQVLYVGDRLNVDLEPAQRLGMATCFIRRGPWGHAVHTPTAVLERCEFRIDSLAELPELIAKLNAVDAVS
jgi:HAD superfamily hydrolase (TIGR01662 family)